jgi:hypothetical protein
MKKLFILAAFGLGVLNAAMATGSVGVNPPQSGTINFTNGSAATQVTNTFAYSYTVPPVVTLYALTTNTLTLTNVFVTTTNFAVGVNVNGTTNGIVYWTSAVGATRLEYGIQVMGGSGTTNVTFPYPYAYVPVVQIEGNGGAGTNALVSVTAVTTTNFTLTCPLAQTNSWISVGTVANPQSPNSGPFPGLNTVIQ